jgi:hypothetical protein
MANATALRETLSHEGPFASVHLDASHDTEDAVKLAELRWRAAREQLEALNAPSQTISALADAMDGPPPVGRAGRLLVAAENVVLVDEYLSEPPAQLSVRVSSLPYLLPLTDWSEREVPHVAVAVDETGADVLAVDANGVVLTEAVAGANRPVHKVRAGGWAHRNMQRHAEENVRRNVTDVAAEVARLAERTDARLIAIAGDPRVRSQLRDALPDNRRHLVAEIDHGRAEDPSHHAVDDEIDALLAARQRAELDELLERFNEAGGAPGLAAQGMRDTTAALRDGNAEILIMDARAVADRTVWTATDHSKVSVSREELHQVGVSDRGEVRADEALPAAAIATGTEVVAILGDEPRLDLANGVGAVLRHR